MDDGSVGRSGNGWAHDDPGAVVQAAVDAIGHDDPAMERWAQLAADMLTAGEGYGGITQHRLQEFLWFSLPRKLSPEDHAPTLAGMERLLDQLGLDRFADIVRSDNTREIISAWEEDGHTGFERARAGMDASGLVPPETELLSWGGVMGMEELMAYEAVAWALETALVAGELRPGTAGWRARSATLTRRTLEELTVPLASFGPAPARRLDLVLGSRVEDGVRSGRPDLLRERRDAVAGQFRRGSVAVAPAPPSSEVIESATAPLRWLLEACRDGVRATTRGYLPRTLVVEAAGRFDWWIFDGQPRSEADVTELRRMHEVATRNRWLLSRSGRIKSTRPALALLEDPPALWRAVTATVGRSDAFSSAISELIALRLLEGPATYISLERTDELTQALAPVLLAQGWRQGSSHIDAHDVGRALHVPLGEWRIFGFLEEEWPARGISAETRRYTLSLTETGRTAALAHLYARATEPRHDIYG
jgi:hypothetical protein